MSRRWTLHYIRPALAVIVGWALGGMASAHRVSPVVAERGTAAKCSVLTNLSCGASPCADIDPSLPTFVITHGWNPAPNRYRLTTPQAYAYKIRTCHGGQVNVLAFHWDSGNKGTADDNIRNAVCAGRELGRALLCRGIVPERTTMIGHSMGTLVVSSAANAIFCETGQCINKLSLIDGPKRKLPIIVNELNATGCAIQITNVWAKGVSGLGAPIHCSGVINIQAPTRRRHFRCRGWLRPARNNHIDIVLWYYEHFL